MALTRKQEVEDMAMVLNSYLNVTRCPGGRITVEGYICPHCDHDMTTDGKCGWSKAPRAVRTKEQAP